MENKLVRKSNYLVEAAYKLSAVEQKIVLVLASMIRSTDKEFKPYVLKIRNFSGFIGLDSKADYDYLKGVTRTLLEKVFVIRTPDSEIQTHWLSSVEYCQGRGSVSFTFDPNLRSFLLQLKERFTTFRLRDVVQLRSGFSIRMYELLKEYENLGSRVFELATLKEVLGMEPSQYPLYADFKKRVIVPAQKELGAKTDISFQFEEIKSGRAVAKLRFRISQNENYRGKAPVALPQNVPENLEHARLMQLLPERYQKAQSVRQLLGAYLKKCGFDYVARNIEYANAKSNAVNNGRSLGKGSNYRSYLAIALRGDFGLPFKEDLEAAKSNQVDNRQKEAELAKVQQEQMERSRLDQQNMDRARIYLDNLPPEARDQVREEAFESLNPQEKSLVLRKTPGAEILLKIAMTRICTARMHISQPDLIENDTSA